MNITIILTSNSEDPLKGESPFTPLLPSIILGIDTENSFTFINMLNNEKPNYSDKPDLVGLSIRASAHENAIEICKKYKSLRIPVVVGGPQPSVTPFSFVNYADAVVVGEIETIWEDLLNDFKSNKLKKLYVNSPSAFNSRGYSALIKNELPNLESLPSLNTMAISNKKLFEMTYYGRGCSINCDFCVVSDIFGTKMRFRKTSEVIKDIKSFKKYYYLIDDSVFGHSNSYDKYKALYREIIDNNIKKYWTGQANLDAAASPKGKEVIELAAKSGLIYAAVGIETLDEEALNQSGAIKKLGVKNGEILSDITKNINFLKKNGIFMSAWFVIGSKKEDASTFYKALEFCKKTDIMPVISPAVALPGSRLFKSIFGTEELFIKKEGISNIPNRDISDLEILNILRYMLKNNYNIKQNFSRLITYFKIFIKTNSFGDTIHKIFFIYFTQKNMKRFVKKDMEWIKKNIKQ